MTQAKPALIPSVSVLVLVRRELRQMRIRESLLAPQIIPLPPDPFWVVCQRCGTPKQPYMRCRACHPVGGSKRQPRRLATSAADAVCRRCGAPRKTRGACISCNEAKRSHQRTGGWG